MRGGEERSPAWSGVELWKTLIKEVEGHYLGARTALRVALSEQSRAGPNTAEQGRRRGGSLPTAEGEPTIKKNKASRI